MLDSELQSDPAEQTPPTDIETTSQKIPRDASTETHFERGLQNLRWPGHAVSSLARYGACSRHDTLRGYCVWCTSGEVTGFPPCSLQEEPTINRDPVSHSNTVKNTQKDYTCSWHTHKHNQWRGKINANTVCIYGKGKTVSIALLCHGAAIYEHKVRWKVIRERAAVWNGQYEMSGDPGCSIVVSGSPAYYGQGGNQPHYLSRLMWLPYSAYVNHPTCIVGMLVSCTAFVYQQPCSFIVPCLYGSVVAHVDLFEHGRMLIY
jgi:hypothetical protein